MVAAPPAPTLTFLPAGNGLGPRVLVEFAGLDVTATAITVTCIAGGETRTVRGARKAATAGSFTVVDFEAPFTAVTYQGQVWAGATASPLGATSTVAVTVDADEVWLSDPLDPENSMRVSLEGSSLQGVQRTPDFEVLHMIGRKKNPVQFFGLGGITNLPFHPITETAADAQKLLGLLDVAPLLVRSPAGGLFQLLPATLYAVLSGSGAWPGWTGNFDAVQWTLTAEEVAPQTLDVVLRTVTIQTYMDAYPLISDLMGAYATMADEMHNPPGGY